MINKLYIYPICNYLFRRIRLRFSYVKRFKAKSYIYVDGLNVKAIPLMFCSETVDRRIVFTFHRSTLWTNVVPTCRAVCNGVAWVNP